MKQIMFNRLLLLAGSLLVLHIGWSQPPKKFINIKGIVLDENDKPVQASVLVKGTQKGVYTNADGTFVLLQVAENAVLQISGINIRATEVMVNARQDLGTISVSSQVTAGEEVVVKANTGYQTLAPNEVNGSVVVLSEKQLNLQTGTNILNRLDGSVSGLLFNIGKNNQNPQNKTGISIRGVGTINGPLDPLIVLDGFIYEGNIENINPNDVESVTVLKDAASASIWGARAGNGVIVINTKRANFNQKMQVDFSTGFIIADKPNLDGVGWMNQSDYIDVEEFFFNKGFYDGRILGTPYLSLSPAQQIFLNRKRGLISAPDSASQIDALRRIDTRQQYLDLIYRQAFTQQHAITFRGGSSGNAYTFAAAYDEGVGNLRETSRKINLRLGNSFKIHRNIRLSLETYFTQSKELSGQRPYGELRPADGPLLYYDLKNADGSAKGWDYRYHSGRTDTLLGGRLLDNKYYFLDDYLHNRTTTNVQEIFSNLGLNVVVAPFLNLDLKYQYQVQNSVAEKIADIESYEARSLINSFTQVDPATGRLIYNVPKAGFRSTTNGQTMSQTARAQLNLIKRFGSHKLDAIAGSELREVKNDNDSYTAYGYDANPLATAAVDFSHGYPDLIAGYSIGIPGSPFLSRKVLHFTALFMNASWVWKEKYGLSASARRDGSNIFGADANDRWKPLWSAGASWRLSKESFLQIDFIDDLRLKLSYGHSGNVDLSKTAVPVAFTGSTDGTSNLPYSRIRQLNNPLLRWEQVHQLNIGTEFSLLKSRLQGSLEWYSKNGSDLYGPIDWDYTTFGSGNTITANVADTKGRGLDLNLQSKNIDLDIKWNSSLWVSYNKTVTKNYYGPNAKADYRQIEGGRQILPVVGRDLYGIVAYQWAGLDAQGNPQGYVKGSPSADYNALRNESLSGSNLVYYGSGTPRYFGSLLNQFAYKRFLLSVNVTGKLDYYFFKPALSYVGLALGYVITDDYKNRWKQAGDELSTTVPSFAYPINPDRDYFYSGSSVHVRRGDHIRLQYINLAYTPKINAIKKVRNLQIYVNAANLGILWRANSESLDPDYVRGLPPSTTWSAGLRANF